MPRTCVTPRAVERHHAVDAHRPLHPRHGQPAVHPHRPPAVARHQLVVRQGEPDVGMPVRVQRVPQVPVHHPDSAVQPRDGNAQRHRRGGGVRRGRGGRGRQRVARAHLLCAAGERTDVGRPREPDARLDGRARHLGRRIRRGEGEEHGNGQERGGARLHSGDPGRGCSDSSSSKAVLRHGLRPSARGGCSVRQSAPDL